MKIKYQKPLPVNSEKTGMARGKRDEIWGASESAKLSFSGKKQVSESHDNARVTVVPLEQNQRVRQTKGNQEMHDELKLKADELEKLFAEHKLRVPRDQSSTARRIEPADAHVEEDVKLQSRRPGVGESTPQPPSRSSLLEPSASSGTKLVMKTVDNHNNGDALRQNFLDLNFGDESRGMFYEKYMKKRNAKLQEEWSLNRSEKEARMKAMQDSLDRSRSEMKAKFSGSMSRQNSAGGSQHAEIGCIAIEDGAYNNNGKVSLSQKSGNSGSEIGDSTRSLAQVDPILRGEMLNAFSSTFNGVGSLQDSLVESPVSSNSRIPRASIDSPIGSSWNPRSLIQGDNDAARMRNTWSSAQKPFIAANSSQNQPRKDVTKGFKRLLKFGRKKSGSETLTDWISATTSEGDDDMDDDRDLAYRSSDDLRKSRMGFSHGHPTDESFNKIQSLQSFIPSPPAHFKLRDDHISGSLLKAPKSFFSLSTFRSKGSDSKPR